MRARIVAFAVLASSIIFVGIGYRDFLQRQYQFLVGDRRIVSSQDNESHLEIDREYLLDQLDGRSVYRRIGGTIQRIESYSLGALNGEVIEFDAAGLLKRRNHFVGGKRNGTSELFNSKGQLLRLTTYSDGARNGNFAWVRGSSTQENGAFTGNNSEGTLSFLNEVGEQKTIKIERRYASDGNTLIERRGFGDAGGSEFHVHNFGKGVVVDHYIVVRVGPDIVVSNFAMRTIFRESGAEDLSDYLFCAEDPICKGQQAQVFIGKKDDKGMLYYSAVDANGKEMKPYYPSGKNLLTLRPGHIDDSLEMIRRWNACAGERIDQIVTDGNGVIEAANKGTAFVKLPEEIGASQPLHLSAFHDQQLTLTQLVFSTSCDKWASDLSTSKCRILAHSQSALGTDEGPLSIKIESCWLDHTPPLFVPETP